MIRMEKRGLKKLTIILIVIGVIILIGLIIILANLLVKNKVTELIEEPNPDMNSCMTTRLRVLETDTESDTIIIERLAGGADGDVTGVTILIEGIEAEILTPQEQGLKQLETKTYKVDYDIQPGDEIKVGALIGTDKWKCNPVSSKTAE